VLLAAAVGCGGGGGGGGGGGDARVSGNVATASTAERQSATKTWLARIGEEVLGLARRAYAAADSTLGGITITVSRGSSDSNDVTDDQGNFDLPNAPSGDVTVSFQRGSCNASVSLPDVAEGSTLDLQDVTVACNDASPGKVAETFQGVILNKPNSPNGNLNVCAFAGGGNHHRAVNSSGSTNFVGTSFAALQVGDIIESTGARAGNGGNSTLFATSIQKVGTGSIGNCAGIPTPTPEPTATGTPAGTVTPGSTPTPESTATPTPTP
jgi:hypothetical protein